MYNETLRHQKETVTTGDSSDTLYSYEFNEHYHSTKDGALAESLNKHVIPAFKYNHHKKHLKILDICFGLGYNTLATLYYIQKNSLDLSIEIYSPEFDLELIHSLKNFKYPKEFDSLKEIITTLSNKLEYSSDTIRIKIVLGDARVSIPKLSQKFDIIYQDAFSPQSNPLLWTQEYFGDIQKIMVRDGILTTYSIALASRLALYANGFKLYLYQDQKIRSSTIASLQNIKGLEEVDMAHKIAINPNAKPLRDRDFLS
ncbi:MAG: MnmC family methyltransferase [Campylobacterota bacterium]|nr:MnmC family methyltransferase [Campylobacterota bacterium]